MIAHHALAILRPAIPVFAAAGFLLGTGYFASLRRGVRRSIVSHAWLQYVLWAIARIGAAVLFFVFAARWGAPALLAAFAGFLTARQLAVRTARRLA